MEKLLALICFIVLCIGCSQSSPDSVVQTTDRNPQKEPTSSAQVSSEIDSIAMSFLQKSNSTALTIGIINGDKVLKKYYGKLDRNSSQAPDSSTIYEIGSITKTFTGILLAHAVNEGKLKLTDDIRKYLPGRYPQLEYKGQPIQIVHLSNHNSGLPRKPHDLAAQPNYNPKNQYAHYTKEMMLNYLNQVKINQQPGTVIIYSNYAVGLLGIILERIYHKPLELLVKQVITDPLGMHSTTFEVAEGNRKYIKGYDRDTGLEASHWYLAGIRGCGGLKSNLDDMLRYVQANISLTKPDMELSHQESKDANNKPNQQGLGWGMAVYYGGFNSFHHPLNKTNRKEKLICHGGETAGFNTFAGFLKSQKKGIVVLSNSNKSTVELAVQILKVM